LVRYRTFSNVFPIRQQRVLLILRERRLLERSRKIANDPDAALTDRYWPSPVRR
jgi:hypothetical protein